MNDDGDGSKFIPIKTQKNPFDVSRATVLSWTAFEALFVASGFTLQPTLLETEYELSSAIPTRHGKEKQQKPLIY